MGTRCMTYVFEEGPAQEPIVCLYRQMDGYPEVHGQELKDILAGWRFVNGIGGGLIKVSKDGRLRRRVPFFNGAGEMAAILVRELKARNDVGNVYLMPPVWPPPDVLQDFEYYVVGEEGERSPTVWYRCCYEEEHVLRRLFGPRGDPPERVVRMLKGRYGRAEIRPDSDAIPVQFSTAKAP